jgi:hypothetical protein
MADRIKDAEDQLLEALFAAEPIADDGFSVRIVRRIRRRLWVRRLALPIAIFVGAAIAVEPAADLMQALSGLSSLLPTQFLSIPTGWIPQLQIVVLAGMLVATGVFGLRMLEE